MAKKPLTRAERVEVVYDKRRWKLLKEFRSKAMQVIEILDRFHLSSIVETALERAEVPVNRRVVVQATPLYAVKGYLEIDEQRCVSFPLVKLRPVERDFYKFSGEVSLSMLKNDVRVLGVDKRLMLIEPTLEGHVESTVVGREETVARLLGVSLNTVLDRVHALLRRDEVGRTGVFIERELSPDETFEMVLKKLADQNPAVRRRLKLSEK